MKKSIVSILILLMIVLASGITGTAASEVSFQVDGKEVLFDASSGYPYLDSQGRTMMPLRSCLDAIGCSVSWDPYSQAVNTTKGLNEVVVPIGQPQILINGERVPIDTVAVLKNGRTYLPLRAVLEAYQYDVTWDSASGMVKATSRFTPGSINGGSTGVFLRKQLEFSGYDGIQADIVLPNVKLGQKGDCPYVYFGFDFADGNGNTEGGFQFIEDQNNPGYNKWTVYLRQGSAWSWGDNILLEQGSLHNLKFYADPVSETAADLVIVLDGKEVIRKPSAVKDFRKASVKYVDAIAMSVPFDGTNCPTASTDTGCYNLVVSKTGSAEYTDYTKEKSYCELKNGYWYGTVECIPDYIHYGGTENFSLYRTSKTGGSITLSENEITSGIVSNTYAAGGRQAHDLTPDELKAFLDFFNSCGFRKGEREWTTVNDHNHLSDSIDLELKLSDGSSMFLSAYYDGDIPIINEHGSDYYLHNAALQDYVINTMGNYLNAEN